MHTIVGASDHGELVSGLDFQKQKGWEGKAQETKLLNMEPRYSFWNKMGHSKNIRDNSHRETKQEYNY